MNKRLVSRNSNIEMLRIVAMAMIIGLHYLYTGGVLENLVDKSSNYYLAWLLESICYPSVNCFILISGYFLSDKEEYDFRRIIEIVLQVVFYSLGLYLLFCVFGFEKFSINTMITGYMFPIIHGEYWYATVYVVSLFAVPYIGKLTKSLEKKQYKDMLIKFGILFSVVPTAVFFTGNTIGLESGYSLIWFIYLYFLGGYIKKYRISFKKNFLVLGIIGFSLTPFLCKLFQQIVLKGEYWNLYKYNSVPVLGGALCWFILFISLENKENHIINIIASTTFGVFLFHTQYIMRDRFLWDMLIKPQNYINKQPALFIIHFIIAILMIFFAGVIIDLIRNYFFMKIKQLLKE